jgi:SEC-C motif-containing protein
MPTPPAPSANATCPCGSGRAQRLCCARFHAGETPPDAEALMRSRYCAYVFGHEDYLLATWHATTRPPRLDLDVEPMPRWLGLDVKRHVALDDDHASVEFVARYRIEGRAVRLHETSRFVRENGRWYYVDGEFPEDERTDTAP